MRNGRTWDRERDTESSSGGSYVLPSMPGMAGMAGAGAQVAGGSSAAATTYAAGTTLEQAADPATTEAQYSGAHDSGVLDGSTGVDGPPSTGGPPTDGGTTGDPAAGPAVSNAADTSGKDGASGHDGSHGSSDHGSSDHDSDKGSSDGKKPGSTSGSGGDKDKGKDGGSSSDPSQNSDPSQDPGSGDPAPPPKTSDAARLTVEDMEKVLEGLDIRARALTAKAADWNAAATELHDLVTNGSGKNSLGTHVNNSAAAWTGSAAEAFTYHAGQVGAYGVDVALAFGQPVGAGGSATSMGVAQALTTAATAATDASAKYLKLRDQWGSPARPAGQLVQAVVDILQQIQANPQAAATAKSGRLTSSITASSGQPGHQDGQQIQFKLSAAPLPEEQVAYVFHGALAHQIANPGAGQKESISLQLSDGQGSMNVPNGAHATAADVQKYFVAAYTANLVPLVTALQTAYETAKDQLPEPPAKKSTTPPGTTPVKTPVRDPITYPVQTPVDTPIGYNRPLVNPLQNHPTRDPSVTA